jgi:hypothetical protein
MKEQVEPASIEVMQLRPPCCFLSFEEFPYYQGMRVKTPARINNAASRAATTAQLSIDNNQLFREFSATALVLIVVLSLFLVQLTVVRRA